MSVLASMPKTCSRCTNQAARVSETSQATVRGRNSSTKVLETKMELRARYKSLRSMVVKSSRMRMLIARLNL